MLVLVGVCLLPSRVYAAWLSFQDPLMEKVFEGLLGRFSKTGTIAYAKRTLNKSTTENESIQQNVHLFIIEISTHEQELFLS